LHSSASLDDEATDDNTCSVASESGSEKENIPPLPPSRAGKKSCAKGKGLVSQVKPTNKVSAKGTRATEYNGKDLLILSQSFIRCSENAIDGTSQKRNKFWDDVSVVFNELKKQQEAYDSRQRHREKYHKVLLKGQFLSDDDDDDSSVEAIVPVRTSSSLQQKWSKFVLPNVTKFISLTTRYPMISGEGKFVLNFVLLLIFDHLPNFLFFPCPIVSDKNRYYNRIHLIFLEQNPNISSFDLYRPSWEFLKDSPKFASITAALASNPCIKAATKRKPSITPDNGTELFSPDPNIYTLETPNERESRPIGNKASKRRQEEEKILESVTSKLKDGLHNNNSGGAGFAIAKAIGDFTNILAMTLQQWNDRQSYDNSNPELKKRYDELLIMEKVHQMEAAQRRREALQQHHNQEIQRSTEDAGKDD
jgi:hypothetical protein